MIVGLLLAAGGARRFGSQKLIQRLDGVPLVRHAANMLAATADTVVAVVGFDATAVRAALDGSGASIVENPDWARGLSSSLRCGIGALPPDATAVVVALGDQPRVDADVVRRVIAAWRSNGRAVVSARYQGVRGHPVLFDRSVFAELLTLDGDSGARALIERSPERVAYVDVESPMPSDVDLPADLAALDAAAPHSPGASRGGIVEPHQPI